ncbi:hypothetical protein EJ08DRAFT_253228 [Tothia fuscella]|uniref:Uncharacterized protein n=1 Tax=Tothia fuscella TaxID=1048955 RepID=A0A9P4TXA5_9PEZI|nr:hypothetical protein EJ08DRAFT_253228 [Tothia fuscella]
MPGESACLKSYHKGVAMETPRRLFRSPTARLPCLQAQMWYDNNEDHAVRPPKEGEGLWSTCSINTDPDDTISISRREADRMNRPSASGVPCYIHRKSQKLLEGKARTLSMRSTMSRLLEPADHGDPLQHQGAFTLTIMSINVVPPCRPTSTYSWPTGK